MKSFSSLYRVNPGKKIRLKHWDPEDKSGFHGAKEEGLEKLKALNQELDDLQALLYAERLRKVLIVLQGMDTSGKDGVIKSVFEGVNPQGVHVVSFKRPSTEELEHDFLWRVHRWAPRRGDLVVFNRSHYEDVLAPRVHGFVSERIWKKRYEHIVNFERLLMDEGTTVLKFYLNIDKEEQKERLQARLDDPKKHWKFNPGDLAERKLWNRYQEAYEDLIGATSTDFAPWHIIPSNRKWYRNLAVASLIVDALKSLKMRLPKPQFDPKSIRLR